MKTPSSRAFPALAVGILIASCSATSLKPARWYTMEQVARGQPLYAARCAGCHGIKGEGAPRWETPLPSGSYPPQPLDGSGHSWHHPLDHLKETIARGGTHPGGTMPGFAGTLTDEEQLAVIAAFQNFWDDRTYEGWLGRGGLSE
jgi:mono/diheme cytochrome c family protein